MNTIDKIPASDDISPVPAFDLPAIVDHIRHVMREKDMSQNELSALSGVPVPTLSKILSHKTPDPRFESIARIARALNISLDTLTQKATESDSIEPEIPDTNPDGEINRAFLRHLVAAYQQVISSLMNRIDYYEADRKAKKTMRITKDVLLIIVVILLAFYLTWDITHPTMGYIQYEIYVKQLNDMISDIFTA